MAVENPKMCTVTVPKKSRLEMNVRQLLNKCELIAKEEPVDSNWRLKKYVESLTEMMTELKTGPEYVYNFLNTLKHWQTCCLVVHFH